MSEECISRIVFETATVIWEVLKLLVFEKPTQEMWLRSAAGFESLWQLAHCIGAIDGKHFRIKVTLFLLCLPIHKLQINISLDFSHKVPHTCLMICCFCHRHPHALGQGFSISRNSSVLLPLQFVTQNKDYSLLMLGPVEGGVMVMCTTTPHSLRN